MDARQDHSDPLAEWQENRWEEKKRERKSEKETGRVNCPVLKWRINCTSDQHIKYIKKQQTCTQLSHLKASAATPISLASHQRFGWTLNGRAVDIKLFTSNYNEVFVRLMKMQVYVRCNLILFAGRWLGWPRANMRYFLTPSSHIFKEYAVCWLFYDSIDK